MFYSFNDTQALNVIYTIIQTIDSFDPKEHSFLKTK